MIMSTSDLANMDTQRQSDLTEGHLDVEDGVIAIQKGSGSVCPHVKARKNMKKYVLFAVLGILGATAAAFGIYFIYQAIWRHKVQTYAANLTHFINNNEHPGKKELYKAHAEELKNFYGLGGISSDHAKELDELIKYNAYTQQYNKQYATVNEKHRRYLDFKNNVAMIEEHNNGTHGWTMEVNKFADWSDKEINSFLNQFKTKEYVSYEGASKENPNRHRDFEFRYKQAKKLDSKAPIVGKLNAEGIDWRRTGAVSTPRDQGHCGSCWAFAAVGAIESLYKIEDAQTYILSEQELTSCDDNSSGCSGGYSDSAFRYVIKNGLSSLKNYPYTATDAVCAVPPGDKIFIDSYGVKSGKAILDELLIEGPSVVYMGVAKDFMFYAGGVYDGPCAGLNHAVLLVGEDSSGNAKDRHFIVKNSWGTNWGENGFFRIKRLGTGNDKCGILTTGFKPYSGSLKRGKKL